MFIRRVVKILSSTMFLLVLFIVPTFLKIAHANSTAETFDLALTNPDIWEDQRGTLDYFVDGSAEYAKFSTNGATLSFPYYRSYNFDVLETPIEYIDLRIKLHQIGVTQGAGVLISDNLPHEGDSINFSNLLFYIWPKPDGSFHLFTNLCPFTNPTCDVNDQLINGVFAFEHNQWLKFVIEKVFNHYEISVDDQIIFSTIDTGRLVNSFGVGSPIVANNLQAWPSYYVDFVGINRSAPDFTSFLHYSQLDPIWAQDEYDHASEWASEGDREMEEWGCAVSSAAMVLAHYDVNHPTTNEVTDPQILNDWLASQPDGYVRNGLTNWLAIARYAHLSELAGYAPNSLEYIREVYSEASVSASLASDPSEPVIVRDSTSHFFPIYGEDAGNWLISDPLASASGTTSKTTPLLTSHIYTPSHTDLSYMMWVIEPDAVLRFYDSADNLLPTESVIEEIVGPGGTTGSVQIVYYRQPITGAYRVEIENPGGDIVPVDMYFYNQAGEVEQIEDELGAGEKKGWEIEYDKDGEDIVSMVELDITAPEIMWDQPIDGQLVNGAVMLQASCDEECDYVNFWWRHESEGYSNVTPDRRYHYEYDNGTTFSWEMDTRDVERWGGDPSYDMSDGTYYLYAAGKDVSGNWARTPEISIVVDHTAPAQVSGMTIRDADGVDLGCSGATNQRRITIDWVDSPESDFDHYLYSIKDREDYRALTSSYLTGDIRDIDGEYKYRVKAVDMAGNVGEASEWCHVTLDRFTPTQPGAPWTTPNPTNGLLQSWFWGESIDDGSGVNGYYNRVYNALSGTYLSDWLWLGKVLGTSTDLSDGEWQMVVKAADKAGNESGMASSETLLVDTIMPILSGKTSLSETWYNTPQTVQFQYSDLHLLGTYTDPWCEINTESFSAYCYVTPYVCDTAGNCNNTQVFSDSIGLDTTAPSVNVNEWGSRISGTANDNLSGVEKVEIKLTKPGESEVVVIAVGTTSWTYTIEPAPVGSYIAKISAYDNAGNVSDEIMKEYDINESDPPSSPEVLGVSTESSPSPTPTPSPTPFASSTDESPSPSPSESPAGKVLGESDETESQSNYWWWLLLLLVPGGWYLSKRL